MGDQECPWSRAVTSIARRRGAGLRSPQEGEPTSKFVKKLIPFSAFWLRSSVVSVLISLISDTWANGPHDIKFIFLG
uniref:Uncharacterized protein n=1 Tax=Populus trichocarpa TaxID=3694 RepID=U5FU07_POPTR